MVNKLMTTALKLELPDLAIDMFEDSFGFYFDPDPAKGKTVWIKNELFITIFCVSFYKSLIYQMVRI